MSEKVDVNTQNEQSGNIEDVTFESQKKETKTTNSKGDKKSASKKSGQSKEKKELNGLKEKYADLNDKYLRLYSEFDNYRKRTARERIDLQKSASKELIIELLAILDDFERAIEAFEEHNLSEEAKKGIELIYNKLKTALKQKGLQVMDVKGQEFHTDFHEAISEIPAPSDDLKGKVTDVVQQGYMLNGKVLRYAKVVVGK